VSFHWWTYKKRSLNLGCVGPTIKKWCNLVEEGLIKRGRDPKITTKLADMMHEAGCRSYASPRK
jgi:hypothetical protein